jgi:hypothetical protein
LPRAPHGPDAVLLGERDAEPRRRFLDLEVDRYTIAKRP